MPEVKKQLNDFYALAVRVNAESVLHLPADTPPHSVLLPRNSRILPIGGRKNGTICATAIVGVLSGPIILQTADCIPCVAYEPSGQIAGIAHLGYRQLLAGAPRRFLAALRKNRGGDLDSFRFFFGPSICANCYTHDNAFLRIAKWHFIKHFTPYGAFALNPHPGVRTFDLTGACIGQFTRFGIPPERIELSPWCTNCTLGNSFHYLGKRAKKITTVIGPLSAIERLYPLLG